MGSCAPILLFQHHVRSDGDIESAWRMNGHRLRSSDGSDFE